MQLFAATVRYSLCDFYELKRKVKWYESYATLGMAYIKLSCEKIHFSDDLSIQVHHSGVQQCLHSLFSKFDWYRVKLGLSLLCFQLFFLENLFKSTYYSQNYSPPQKWPFLLKILLTVLINHLKNYIYKYK